MDIEAALTNLERAAQQHAGLRLLVLHGSRSRQQEHAASDWDLGYLADAPLDPAELTATVMKVLATDHVDVTDLARASALLRFRAASDGRCIYELAPGTFESFVLAATLFWCDAGPVIQRAQAAVLSDLTV